MITVSCDIRPLMEMMRKDSERVLSSAIGKLIEAGEHFLDVAYNDRRFTNVSGNLCSSIGYGVYADGKEVKVGGFRPTDAPKGDGSHGQMVGLALLRKVASSHSKGLRLITVAGESYSVIKESEGTPVIAHAQLSMEKLLKEMFRR